MYELIERKPIQFDGLGDVMAYTHTGILIIGIITVIFGASLLLGVGGGGSAGDKIIRTILSFIMFSIIVSGMVFMIIRGKAAEIRDVQKNGVDRVVYERKGVKVAGFDGSEPCHYIKVATPKTREDGSYEYISCVDIDGLKKGDTVTVRIDGEVSGDLALPKKTDLDVISGTLDRHDISIEKEGAKSNEK